MTTGRARRTAQRPTETVAVTVAAGHLIFDGQVQRGAGETVETDAWQAAFWCRRGWAEPTTRTKK